MVQMCGNIGAEPFSSWKKGAGFGSRCRSYYKDPSVPKQGSQSANGHNYYAHNQFWLSQYELRRATSFGVNDRPSYERDQYTVSPAAYNPKTSSGRKDIVYKNLTMAPYFPSSNQKALWGRFSGPGPAKYDTAPKTGSLLPSYTIGSKLVNADIYVEGAKKPGPGTYETRQKPGAGMRPIKFTTRARPPDSWQSYPGPGRYNVPGQLSKYGVVLARQPPINKTMMGPLYRGNLYRQSQQQSVADKYGDRGHTAPEARRQPGKSSLKQPAAVEEALNRAEREHEAEQSQRLKAEVMKRASRSSIDGQRDASAPQ